MTDKNESRLWKAVGHDGLRKTCGPCFVEVVRGLSPAQALELLPKAADGQDPAYFYVEEADPFLSPSVGAYAGRPSELPPEGRYFCSSMELRWALRSGGKVDLKLLAEQEEALEPWREKLECAGFSPVSSEDWEYRLGRASSARHDIGRGYVLYGRFQKGFFTRPASAPWGPDPNGEELVGSNDAPESGARPSTRNRGASPPRLDGSFVEVGVAGAGRYFLPESGRFSELAGGIRVGLLGVQYLQRGLPRMTRLAGLTLVKRDEA